MIKRAFLASVLSLVGFSVQADTLSLTRTYVNRCGGLLSGPVENNMANMQCVAYIQGIEDAIRVQESTNRMIHNKESFCIPSDYTTRTGLRNLFQMVHREPKMLDEQLALMVKLMFVETYPCSPVVQKPSTPPKPLPVPVQPRNSNRQFQF